MALIKPHQLVNGRLEVFGCNGSLNGLKGQLLLWAHAQALAIDVKYLRLNLTKAGVCLLELLLKVLKELFLLLPSEA